MKTNGGGRGASAIVNNINVDKILEESFNENDMIDNVPNSKLSFSDHE